MPRLNMFIISLIAIASMACYHRLDRTREGLFLAEAIDVITRRGLEEIDRQALFDAAMIGMTQELDEHTQFVSREDKEPYQSGLEGHFAGIGVQMESDFDEETKAIKLLIGDTLIGRPTPAHDAGLRAGDQIVAVDGHRLATHLTEEVKEDRKKLPSNDAMNRIKGPAGTKVDITVLRDGEERTFQVTRQEIDVDTIVGEFADSERKWDFISAKDSRIGYIRIKAFNDRTVKELQAAIDTLQQQGPIQALILDLRGNPGGYLTAAVQLCDMFIDRSKLDGLIVSTRDRFGKDVQVFYAQDNKTLNGFPLVILVNGESASASEIFAACLQDHDRAVIVGSRSFGKGSVQEVIDLERGRSLLKLTTNTFWRPSNKQIHKMEGVSEEDDWGVRPDEGWDLPFDDEQEIRRKEERSARDALFVEEEATSPESQTRQQAASTVLFDPQLDKAVEYLQAELEKKSK